jgi:hypothetical protein
VTPRRLLLASLASPALQGCAAPLPAVSTPRTTPEARALLFESAEAHGIAALSKVNDLSVSYAGEWPALVGRLQPALVDSGFRGGSEERLLLRERLVAQAHTGPKGRKQVVRRAAAGAQGDVRVWFNGEEAGDAERRAAAALVADGYSLFLLGPMLLARHWMAERSPVMELAGTERIALHDGRRHECDVLRAHIAPGLGFSESERLALYIDREERLMRRVRFSLNGLESTRGGRRGGRLRPRHAARPAVADTLPRAPAAPVAAAGPRLAFDGARRGPRAGPRRGRRGRVRRQGGQAGGGAGVATGRPALPRPGASGLPSAWTRRGYPPCASIFSAMAVCCWSACFASSRDVRMLRSVSARPSFAA